MFSLTCSGRPLIGQLKSCGLQYRYLIPAPVNRTSASACLYKHPWLPYQKNKPITSMTHLACKAKLRSVGNSSIHPCPENWVAMGHAVVYFAQAAHAFSAGIKCWHCTCHRQQVASSNQGLSQNFHNRVSKLRFQEFRVSKIPR